MDTKRPFPDVFTEPENGFVAPEFCFVAEGNDETMPARLEDVPIWQVVHFRAEKK
jgi:hypothetical protein